MSRQVIHPFQGSAHILGRFLNCLFRSGTQFRFDMRNVQFDVTTKGTLAFLGNSEIPSNTLQIIKTGNGPLLSLGHGLILDTTAREIKEAPGSFNLFGIWGTVTNEILILNTCESTRLTTNDRFFLSKTAEWEESYDHTLVTARREIDLLLGEEGLMPPHYGAV